ncbi:MAG: hypothetical protein QF535_09830, partial [Anaerolineales bacterium]|nr:hypothetical protein [Anaerolineales bacterium]
MPVSKSKQGKPLGGIGAERQSGRKHSIILDDRLLSKQYITNKIEAKDSFLVNEWLTAQKLSSKPVKATLPGPMTITDTVANN